MAYSLVITLNPSGLCTNKFSSCTYIIFTDTLRPIYNYMCLDYVGVLEYPHSTVSCGHISNIPTTMCVAIYVDKTAANKTTNTTTSYTTTTTQSTGPTSATTSTISSVPSPKVNSSSQKAITTGRLHVVTICVKMKVLIVCTNCLVHTAEYCPYKIIKHSIV